MTYFALDRIAEAVERLRVCERKNLLIPLVLAANGVDSAQPVNVRERLGTDVYLVKFFGADLIGVEPRVPGNPCTVAPRFADLPAEGDQIGSKVDGKLWANIFSVQGYPQLRGSGVLVPTKGSVFQLGPGFAAWFRQAIPADFKFEDLLTWCYAFTGVPNGVSTWAELLSHFLQHHTHTHAIPTEYQEVFNLDPAVPWPAATEFQAERPTNGQFQELLFPGSSRCAVEADQFLALYETIARLLNENYLGYSVVELNEIAASVVSALQSCRRLFLLGDPGTGKTQLATLISGAFLEVFGPRVHAVSAPISDGTTPDKLIGFSTLDGKWVEGMLTQPNPETARKLLYPVPAGGAPLPQREREQINVLVLDEANRRDAEDLLAKLQNALDSDHLLPEHTSNQVKLDNSGDAYLSPNTFLLMTGNSPRDDAGRVVQSRPFKRRHNLIMVDNVFERALARSVGDFAADLIALWRHRGTNFSITPDQDAAFIQRIGDDLQTITALQVTLRAMSGFSIGLSYGLAKKLLKTAAARYALVNDFRASVDRSLTESVLPLLSSEVVVNGGGVRETLLGVDAAVRAHFDHFYATVTRVISAPDSFGRPRHFL